MRAPSCVQGRKYKEDNFPSCHEVSDTFALMTHSLSWKVAHLDILSEEI